MHNRCSGDEHEMVLVISMSTIAAFVYTTTLLLTYTVLDLRTRRVPNQVMLVGGIVGLAIVLLFDHIVDNTILHVTAVSVVLILGYIVFRIGALGGADVKALLTIAIISPGIEFAKWVDPILEGIAIVGVQLGITLLCGYLFSRRRTEGSKSIPMIPIILGAYLIVQLLALL
jgi:Flp pilus assembly protein protease CpaA